MTDMLIPDRGGSDRPELDLRLFQQALTLSPQPTVITDSHGSIVFVNAAWCRWTGFAANEVIGTSDSLLSLPGNRPDSADSLPSTLYGKNGRKLLVRSSVHALTGASGAVTHYAIFQYDAGRQQDLREQMRQAREMEMLGRLASGVAHDLNNLLTIILGYAGLLSMEFAKSEMAGDSRTSKKRMESLSEIQLASEKAAMLTSQLLAFSRKAAPKTQSINANSLLRRMEEALRQDLGPAVALELALSSQLGTVGADAGELELALRGLAARARAALKRGGTVRIQTRNVEFAPQSAPGIGLKPGRYVALTVSQRDSGPDTAARLSTVGAFGEGLADARSFVQRNGGALDLKSDPGMGASVTLYLPRVDRKQALSGLGETGIGETGPASQTRGSILVVEVDAGVRLLAREILEAAGYEVIAAADAGEAMELSAAREAPIHVLLTDVLLPVTSGIELAERLKRTRPEMRVLFASGYSDYANMRTGDLEGGALFLPKPFAKETLLAMINRLVEFPPNQSSATAN
jgi:PAS domain S-box-containing protein